MCRWAARTGTGVWTGASPARGGWCPLAGHAGAEGGGPHGFAARCTPSPPRALLCPALQRYVVRQHQLPLLSEVYGTLSYVCSRVTGESPQMSSTCLGKKCSRTKTSSGQGCSLCSLTAAGKTYLRLAGNLGNRKREITGQFESKNHGKSFCQHLITRWWPLLFPGITRPFRQ